MTGLLPWARDVTRSEVIMLPALIHLNWPISKGFSTTLYLDPKEKKYVDEAGPANFFGITR